MAPKQRPTSAQEHAGRLHVSPPDMTQDDATARALGKETAESLMLEMKFFRPLVETAGLNELSEIPERRELNFQIVASLPAAKTQAAENNFYANIIGLEYCVATGRVFPIDMFDIDHTIPFVYIRNKQEKLLTHLNAEENVEFARGFLAVRGIDAYFGEDDINVIYGTNRFYKLCYNDIDNLLLLCHAANMSKGSHDSLAWFGKQPSFGEEFVNAVRDAGGLHDGVITQKICRPTDRTVMIGDIRCQLHHGRGVGLGKFITEWFEATYPKYTIGIKRAYADIWQKIEGQFNMRLSTNTAKAKHSCEMLATVISREVAAITEFYSRPISDSQRESSHTSSDCSEENDLRCKLTTMKLSQVLKQMHILKKIKRLIAEHNPEITQDIVVELYDCIAPYDIFIAPVEVQDEVLTGIYDGLVQKYKSGSKFTIDEIKAMATRVTCMGLHKYHRKRARELAADLANDSDDIQQDETS